MNTLNLCFFWHMHQPDYRGSDGIMKMPWVFLHAIKDYYEMPWLLSEYPGLKATFNLSASLIEQLNLYRQPLKYDYFLTLWIQDPSQLEVSQREWLIKLFTAMQYETMVRPLKRYGELYYQDVFANDELIDLEVLFLLAWCGNYLRLHNDVIKTLLKKEQGYSQEDKTMLLESLSRFVQEILPLYAKLQKEEIVSVSTTPYFHPILPLLLDMENAKRANPTTVLPEGSLSLKEDAHEHVRRSIALYKETFGVYPNGIWPAEGAVDEKSVGIYKEHGIQWIATDEAILHKSLQNDVPSLHYKPYTFEGVTIAFRDHHLSDKIGFEYRYQSAHNASENFMNQLQNIADKEADQTVFIIVDGENAWEFYENNGLDFFTSMYTVLSAAIWCKTVTMDEVAAFKNHSLLEHISPGSWIHGTFDTWVGNSEKNRAWELIFQTQNDVMHHKEDLSDEVKEEMRYHLLASECSDWFWWYGDDHSTDFAYEFDTLFREHLIRVYTLMGSSIPLTLLEPIHSDVPKKPFWIKPSNAISPLINGKKSSFFEWMGCGMIDEGKMFSTMDKVRGPIDIVYYGFDEESLYMAFEGDVSPSQKIVVEIEENEKSIELKPAHLEGRLEFSLSREHFGTHRVIHLRLILKDNNKNIQFLPGFGPLTLDFDQQINWFI